MMSTEDDIDWDKFSQEVALSRQKLREGVCPSCGGSGVTRHIDLRQDGHKGGHEGVWVNYRHECGFAQDHVESE